LGPKVAASLIIGTAGRFLLKVALGAACPALAPYLAVAPLLAEAAIEVIAPPPAIVLTRAAKQVGQVAAKEGLYIILGGSPKKFLIRILDASGVNKLVNYCQQLFKQQEENAEFLGEEENEDTKPRKARRPPMPLPPNRIPTPFTQTLLLKSTALNRSRVTNQRMDRSILKPAAAPVVMECNPEQESLIINNFEGEQLEFKNLNELKAYVEGNEEWKSAVEQLVQDPKEEDWISASVQVNEGPQTNDLAASILDGSIVFAPGMVDLYDSWVDLAPSAPPVEQPEGHYIPVSYATSLGGFDMSTSLLPHEGENWDSAIKANQQTMRSDVVVDYTDEDFNDLMVPVTNPVPKTTDQKQQGTQKVAKAPKQRQLETA
jgi:hypothetical protein